MKDEVDANMTMVLICEMFGWTYYEYLMQPPFFLRLITEKVRIDAKRKQNEMNKMGRSR